MSIDHPPDSFISGRETLCLRDQLRVKTVSVIEASGKIHDAEHIGAWWSDPSTDRRFSLTAHGEWCDADVMNFQYKLRVLEKTRPTVKELYEYDSLFPQIAKSVAINGRVARHHCADEDIITMLGYLESAPASLTPEANMEFVRLMTEGNIHDPRLHMQLKRFAAQALGWFHRQSS